MVARVARGVTVGDEHRALLRRVCGAGELRIAPLAGGLHGRCFRVTTACCDLALRLPSGVDPDPFRLSAAAERRVIAAASAAGLSPEAVEIAPGDGLLATRFLAGAHPWSARDARRRANIERLAPRLRVLHSLDVELPPYRVREAAEHYARDAAAMMPLDAVQRGWRDELLQLAEEFVARFPATVPCHNDLVASNILDAGELWLVDFEYAVASAPILDLAGFAAFNELDRAGRTRLVEAYYAGRPVPFEADAFDAAVRHVRLLSYFWSLTQAGSAQADAAASGFADAMAAMLR